MATYVLVHGAWHGSWCWRKLSPLIKAEGHRVDAVDLPGRGNDRTPIYEMTLEKYAERVRERLESAEEPVILVGHSLGGMVVTQAAELVPRRIAILVYLPAFLPHDGQSLQQLAEGDQRALVRPNMIINKEQGSCIIAEHARRETFYGECDDEDVTFAVNRHVPESLAVIGAHVRITDQRAGSVRRFYIECLRDRAIGIDKQREMYGARPCERVLTIDTDHSPFLSRPKELAIHLLSVAR
jgi:pimeloyl-ACP methyl ester carboxylesterase